MTNKWQFKAEARPSDVLVDHLVHHQQCPTVQVEMHEPLKMIWRSQAVNSGEKMMYYSPSESLHNKHHHSIVVSVRCSFWSVSPEALLPSSTSPRSSVNFKPVIAHFLAPRSGSSASSQAPFSSIPTITSSVISWSRERRLSASTEQRVYRHNKLVGRLYYCTEWFI